MDSLHRLIKKIEINKNDLDIKKLSILVEDLWSWSKQYETGSKIYDLASEIEIVVAVCLDEERKMNTHEIIEVQKFLDTIILGLKSFVV